MEKGCDYEEKESPKDEQKHSKKFLETALKEKEAKHKGKKDGKKKRGMKR